MSLLTAKELAAFLGISESGVRQIVRRNRVSRRATGEFKAGKYDAWEVLRHAGTSDRLLPDR